MLVLGVLALSTAPSALAAGLQISARGQACAVWHGGPGLPPGIGQDCLNHQAVDSVAPIGGPFWGAVDLSSGTCSAIPGVTVFFDNVIMVHDNLVPTGPGQALGYAYLNETSGPFAVAVTLPQSSGRSGQPGSVKQLDKVADADWPPAWSESDGKHVVAWTYVEFHNTASAGVGVNELLQILDPSDGSTVKTLGNVSTEYTNGVTGFEYYGFGHAIDTASGVLYTQSGNQSVRVLDLAKNKSMGALETGGTELLCMHFDSVSKRLGGIVNKTTTMELVSVDTSTGAISSTASWDIKTFPGDLEFVHHDDKPERFPPECTFDQTSGSLAMLMFEQDTGSLPGFDHKQLYVSTLSVRDHESAGPSVPQKLTLPFHSRDKPVGSRTWRALSPSISFL
jgi:hypothetical protein